MNETGEKIVLVVDDDAINRELMGDVLATLKYSVVFAENGDIAVQKCKEGHLDAILLDICMPNKDGFTTAQEIRNIDGENKETPILALTALTETDQKKIKECGIAGIISKPINIDEIKQKLDLIFSGKK